MQVKPQMALMHDVHHSKHSVALRSVRGHPGKPALESCQAEPLATVYSPISTLYALAELWKLIQAASGWQSLSWPARLTFAAKKRNRDRLSSAVPSQDACYIYELLQGRYLS